MMNMQKVVRNKRRIIFFYSILGLRYDVSDEEVKRYYRKQAVLVHPDKASVVNETLKVTVSIMLIT